MATEIRSVEIPLAIGLDNATDVEGNPNGAVELRNFDWDLDGVAIRRGGIIRATDHGLGTYTSDNLPVTFVRAGGALRVVPESELTLNLESVGLISPATRVHSSSAATDPQGLYTLVGVSGLSEDEPDYETPETAGGDAEYISYLYVMENATGKLVQTIPVGFNEYGIQIVALPGASPDERSWAVYTIARIDATHWKYYYRNVSGNGYPFTIAAASIVQSQLGDEDVATADGLMTPLDVAQFGSLPQTFMVGVFKDSGTGGTYRNFVRHDAAGAVQLSAILTGAEDPADTTELHATTWVYNVPSLNVTLVAFQHSDGTLKMWRSPSTVFTIATTTPTAGPHDGFPPRHVTMAEVSPGKLTVIWNPYDSFFLGGQFKYVQIDLATNAVGFAFDYLNAELATKAIPMTLAGKETVVVGVRALGTDANGDGYPNVTLLAIPDLQLDKAPFPVGLHSFDEAGLFSGAIEAWSGWHFEPLPAWSQAADGSFTLPALVALETTAASTNVVLDRVVRRVRIVRLSTNTTPITTTLQNQAFISGGYLQASDGLDVYSAAWLTPPRLMFASPSVGTGLTGTFSYFPVLEFVDHHGNIQVSPPGEVVSTTVVNQNIGMSVEVSTYQSALIGTGGYRVKIYRTLAGGTVFHLLTSFMGRFNSANPQIFVDAIPDVELEVAEGPYAGPGLTTLVSELVPPLRYVCSHRNRLFGIDAVEPETIRFTTETTAPFMPQWNQVLTLRVDNAGGPPLALASLGDKLVILQKDQICVTGGEGPDGNGNGYFAIPEVVAWGVGVEPTQIGSVVETPDGIMFSHRTGIKLLTPQLQIVDVGQLLGGRASGLLFPVTRARHMPLAEQTWFLVNGVETDGSILVWDHGYKRWTVWVGVWDAITDVVEFRNRVFVLVDGSPDIWEYTTLSIADEDPTGEPGVYDQFSQVVGLPWFRGPAEAARAQEMRLYKVHVTGRRSADDTGGTNVIVRTYTQDERKDKSSTDPDQTYVWDGDSIEDMAENWLLSARVVSQRCRAFRCELELALSGDALGYTLSSVVYDYGILPGRGKGPKGRRPSAANG